MSVLLFLLLGLSTWAIWYIDDTDDKVSIFGIVAVILAAFTSVLTVSINNRKSREREYELLILKEKQKVFEHFYNALFDAFGQTKSSNIKVRKSMVEEIMNFKRGLMNWGSERLIKNYIDYDNKLLADREVFQMVKDGDHFLKEIRKEMGFNDSKDLNLMSIILTPEARQELIKTKTSTLK